MHQGAWRRVGSAPLMLPSEGHLGGGEFDALAGAPKMDDIELGTDEAVAGRVKWHERVRCAEMTL